MNRFFKWLTTSPNIDRPPEFYPRLPLGWEYAWTHKRWTFKCYYGNHERCNSKMILNDWQHVPGETGRHVRLGPYQCECPCHGPFPWEAEEKAELDAATNDIQRFLIKQKHKRIQ